MKYIYIPGFSLNSRVEASINLENIKKSYLHKYRHWSFKQLVTFANRNSIPDNLKWDIEAESNEVDNNLRENNFIIAKSIGTLVTLSLLQKVHLDKIKGIIFLGIPYNDLNEVERLRYKEVLSKINCPFTVIQNKDDDHGSVEQVKQMLDGLDYTLIIKDADHHRYNYPEEILEIIK